MVYDGDHLLGCVLYACLRAKRSVRFKDKAKQVRRLRLAGPGQHRRCFKSKRTISADLDVDGVVMAYMGDNI